MRSGWLAELRRRRTSAEIDASLASLVVHVEDDVALVTRMSASSPTTGVPLFGSSAMRAGHVRMAPQVYAQTPTSAARVRLLAAAASIAPRIEVHVPTTSVGTHRGRLAIDVPRRLARAFGLPAGEPGDRFRDAVGHVFFDDEDIIEEAQQAGLDFTARRGAVVVLERDASQPAERPDRFARELLSVCTVIREAERLRLHRPPAAAVATMRERGRGAARRGPIGRARLRRAIGWMDAAFRGGPNCFRRTLAELALDAGAAEEPLVFGLDVGRTGHVALKDSEDCTFDVAFEIAADGANASGGSTWLPAAERG